MAGTLKWFKILGSNIRPRREAMRKSQEEVADQAGIDVRYLGGIERAQRNPSLKVIIAIAQALETSPLDLISDADDRN